MSKDQQKVAEYSRKYSRKWRKEHPDYNKEYAKESSSVRKRQPGQETRYCIREKCGNHFFVEHGSGRLTCSTKCHDLYMSGETEREQIRQWNIECMMIGDDINVFV